MEIKKENQEQQSINKNKLTQQPEVVKQLEL